LSSPSAAHCHEGWQKIVAKYREPSAWRALWQLTNTLVPYALLWCLMPLCLSISYWLLLPVAALAAGLLVRIFIIFHDCGHGSFMKSRRANDLVGFATGLLTFTPYYFWRWQHALHHGTAGDLDRRGSGDVWTLTVQEYVECSRWKRLAYRLSRNPLVLFVIAPLFLFVVLLRFPSKGAPPRERRSVHWTNLALLIFGVGMSALFGWRTFLLTQFTIMVFSGAAGVWLFYVQHQFEGVYWGRGDEWDYATAAMQGSSFYKLPRILQWFSGNIGFHHIHHLSPRIPNYNLQRCHNAEPYFQRVKPLTLFASLRSLSLRLWDDQRKQLVGYAGARMFRRQYLRQR
jgi:acyl-lipid omega-6 desaturase (Delta-12 desaturase)